MGGRLLPPGDSGVKPGMVSQVPSQTSQAQNESFLQQQTNTQMNPDITSVAIVILVSALFSAGFSTVYLLSSGGSETAERGSDSQGGQGLEKSMVDELPLVNYMVVKNLKEGKEDAECAVCLSDFEEDDKLRLLPKCGHVFHMQCLDEWVSSHSTCPLCRAGLLPSFAGLPAAGSPPIMEVSRRILDAQAESLASPHEVIVAIEDSPDGERPFHPQMSVLASNEVQILMGSGSNAMTEESRSETGPIFQKRLKTRVQDWPSLETPHLSEEWRWRCGRGWQAFHRDIHASTISLAPIIV